MTEPDVEAAKPNKSSLGSSGNQLGVLLESTWITTGAHARPHHCSDFPWSPPIHTGDSQGLCSSISIATTRSRKFLCCPILTRNLRPQSGITLRLESQWFHVTAGGAICIQEPSGPTAQVPAPPHSQPFTLCHREIYPAQSSPVTAEGTLLLGH